MAIIPKTLSEYYIQKGETLPSWRERQPIYQELGLGSAEEYEGRSEQNTALLKALIAKDTTPTPTILPGQREEAPETLVKPTREQFSSDAFYQTALQKFQKTGSWATPTTETPLGLSDEIQTRIKTSIEAYKPHYAEDGEGARERFIESLSKLYGGDKDKSILEFISKEIYTRLPDVIAKEKETSLIPAVHAAEGEVGEYEGQYGEWEMPGKPDSGYSGKWREGYVPVTKILKEPEKPPEEIVTIEPKEIIKEPVIPKEGEEPGTFIIPSGEELTEEEIKNLIVSLQEQAVSAKTELEREEAIKALVIQVAKLGGKYPTEYLDALLTPEKTEEERRKEIYKKYGIEGLETRAFASPEETFESIYKRVLSESSFYIAGKETDISAAKAELRTVADKMDKATADYNEAVSIIGTNPWLGEAGRVGQVKKTFNMYEREYNRLSGRYTLLDNQIVRSEENAKYLAKQVLSEVEKGRELDEAQLDYYTGRANADLEAQTTTLEKEEELELLRYYPEYIAALPKEDPGFIAGTPTSYKEWTLAGKPGTYAEWLISTKKVTEEDRIKDSSKFLEDRKGTDGYVSANDYVEARKEYLAQGGSRGTFEAAFPVESYLGEHEWENLPEDLKPKITEASKTELKAELFENIRAIKSEANKITDDSKRSEYKRSMLQVLLTGYPEFSVKEIEDYFDTIE